LDWFGGKQSNIWIFTTSAKGRKKGLAQDDFD